METVKRWRIRGAIHVTDITVSTQPVDLFRTKIVQFPNKLSLHNCGYSITQSENFRKFGENGENRGKNKSVFSNFSNVSKISSGKDKYPCSDQLISQLILGYPQLPSSVRSRDGGP